MKKAVLGQWFMLYVKLGMDSQPAVKSAKARLPSSALEDQIFETMLYTATVISITTTTTTTTTTNAFNQEKA